MSPLAERVRDARLYLVCGARPGGRDPEPVLRAALEGGVDVLQLREKEAADEDVLRAAEVFARLAAEHDVLFILNDRPDLALRCGADGVHVGQDDMSVEEARAIVGQDLIVGRSTHTPEQVDAAVGVDYIAVGPVNATPTKPGRPAVGLDLVRYASEHARVPFFAIGGIDATNVADVAAAGVFFFFFFFWR